MENNKTLEEKVSSLGNDMIMDAAMSHTKEENEAVEEMVDSMRQNVEGAAIGTADLAELAKAYGMRPKHIKPLTKDNKIGRNDPCPCGSGKKYKNCCLASGKYETYTR